MTDLISKALSSEPVDHLLFADGMEAFVEELVNVAKAVPESWVGDEFLPFLVEWLPIEELEVVTEVVKSMGFLMAHAGPALYGLVERMVCTGSVEVCAALKAKLLNGLGGKAAGEMMEALMASEFDTVRAFVPPFHVIVEDTELLTKVFTTLAFDPAFIVRKAVAMQVKSLRQSLQTNVAYTLLADANPGIRQLIPAAALSFWTNELNMLLFSDSAWTVRAATARALKDTEDCNVLLPYFADATKEVVLTTAKSFLTIIEREEVVNISQLDRFVDYLCLFAQSRSARLRDYCVKIFLNLYNRFPSIIENEKLVLHTLSGAVPDTTIVFMQYALKLGLHDLLFRYKDQFQAIATQISEHPQWRLRQDFVELLSDLSKQVNDDGFHEMLLKVCFGMLGDYSFPVRQSAARQVALLHLLKSTGVPEQLLPFKSCTTFRKRQMYVMVVGELYAITQQGEYEAELKELAADEYSNVNTLCQQYLHCPSPTIEA